MCKNPDNPIDPIVMNTGESVSKESAITRSNTRVLDNFTMLKRSCGESEGKRVCENYSAYLSWIYRV